MDKSEARAFLSLHRAGVSESDDARFAAALQCAETDPELRAWWNEEQAVDRAIAAKLAAAPIPHELLARLKSGATPSPQPIPFAPSARRWSSSALLASAALIALALLLGWWVRPPQNAGVSLGDYCNEMVSFIKLNPALEMQSNELPRLQEHLAQAAAPAHFPIPAKLQNYEPIGCRVLRFHGHDVSLICFKIGRDKLAHLFVIDAKTFARAQLDREINFGEEGAWTTASWTENGQVFLLAVPGDRAQAEKFVGTI